MARSPEYTQGRRAGVKWAITWLHERAKEMNDQVCKNHLNEAAFNMGHDAKRAVFTDEQPKEPTP